MYIASCLQSERPVQGLEHAEGSPQSRDRQPTEQMWQKIGSRAQGSAEPEVALLSNAGPSAEVCLCYCLCRQTGQTVTSSRDPLVKSNVADGRICHQSVWWVTSLVLPSTLSLNGCETSQTGDDQYSKKSHFASMSRQRVPAESPDLYIALNYIISAGCISGIASEGTATCLGEA